MQLVAEMAQLLGVGKSLCSLAALRFGSERLLMGQEKGSYGQYHHYRQR